jgi:hypothetical protein
VLQGEGRGLAYIRRTVPAPVVGAELFVEVGGRLLPVQVVELPYATRTEAQSASGVKATKAAAVGVGEGEKGAAAAAVDAAAAKKAEEERKAKKLEEMRKKLEAFQAAKQEKGA